MIIRIAKLDTLPEYVLKVAFDDGKVVLYDMQEDIETLPGYDALKTIPGLFPQVQMDPSRTCIYWNKEIDLPSDVLYEYGREISAGM